MTKESLNKFKSKSEAIATTLFHQLHLILIVLALLFFSVETTSL
jgi:hypothetical protein